MRVQVTFRINTETGEVEFFQVDDTGQTRQLHDHDGLHEDIALAIARRPGTVKSRLHEARRRLAADPALCALIGAGDTPRTEEAAETAEAAAATPPQKVSSAIPRMRWSRSAVMI